MTQENQGTSKTPTAKAFPSSSGSERRISQLIEALNTIATASTTGDLSMDVGCMRAVAEMAIKEDYLVQNRENTH
jgi:hypothetical protein